MKNLFKTKQQNNKITKQQNNKTTKQQFFIFTNLKNLFTLRSLAILFLTLFLSFWARSFIIQFFNLNYSLLSDFIIVGFIVSFLYNIYKPFTDIFTLEMCQPKDQLKD